jgi:hypothetical protein
MSEELSTLKEFVKEVLIDLRIERTMSKIIISEGIQASSIRGVKASPSTDWGAKPSPPSIENQTKHTDNLENAKLILTIFPDYTPPLASAVSGDSVPRDFE